MGGDLDGEYAPGGFGYTYHDIELSVAPEVGDVDVYKANHHGSSHSSSTTFINQLDPEVSIISAGDGNTYGHPTQQTMDRLLATSTVYLTERGELSTNIGAGIVAGNIVIKTSDGTNYTVNGTPYTATEPTRTDVDGDGYFAEADPDDSDGNLIPNPNGGCGNNYQTCSNTCQVNVGEVLINEIFPNGTPEWVELYNTTDGAINISYCVVDDISGGSAEYHIPAGTFIPAHGFWALDQTTYFNNTGDDVRFLTDDLSTVLDSYTYGDTGAGVSWYRLPDGGSWQVSPTSSTTKGYTNTFPFYPIVNSIVLAGSTPTDAQSVAFNLKFSKSVTGVDAGDFSLYTTGGIVGTSIMNVTGSNTRDIYRVTVNTGSGSGMISLDVVDDNSIIDEAGNKQYRSILSFDTSTLPEGAVITSVTLKFKSVGKSRTLPFNTHGKLLADLCEGAFKNNPTLQLGDFKAKCPTSFYKAKALIYSNSLVDNWYSQSLLPEDFQFINLGGVTQFRLRFAKDDNNDFGADFLKLFSGNALTEADRPQLIIEFFVP